MNRIIIKQFSNQSPIFYCRERMQWPSSAGGCCWVGSWCFAWCANLSGVPCPRWRALRRMVIQLLNIICLWHFISVRCWCRSADYGWEGCSWSWREGWQAQCAASDCNRLEAQPPQDSERALLHSQWLWKECGQCAVLQEELQQPAQVLQEQHPATSNSGFTFLSVKLVFILMSDCRRWSHSQSTCMARLCWWHATLPIPIRSQPICASTYHYCSLCLTFCVWRGFSSPESQPTRLVKMIWMLMSSTCMKGMFRWGRL